MGQGREEGGSEGGGWALGVDRFEGGRLRQYRAMRDGVFSTYHDDCTSYTSQYWLLLPDVAFILQLYRIFLYLYFASGGYCTESI